MNVDITHFPDLIAAMTDADLQAFLSCARRQEEALMSQLYHLRKEQMALNSERDKRRAERRNSLRCKE